MTDEATPPDRPRIDKPQRRVRSRAEFEASVAGFEAKARATNERITARSGRNLPLAIIVGLALGCALLASLIILKPFFMVFALALILTAGIELAGALRASGRYIPRIPVVIGAVAIVPLSFYGIPFWGVSADAGHWYGTLGGIALIAVWRLVVLVNPRRRGTARQVGTDLLGAVFMPVYVNFLAGFAVLMASQQGGEWWVLAFLIIVVTTDTGAYVSGLLFGRHKMAPVISPGKTWEGFIGSAVFAIIAGQVLAPLMLHVPWYVGLILSLVMVVTATGGDLAESLLKRDLGVKDISSWLPGHGGLLDRLDSTLFSAAAAYGLFVIFA